MEKISFVIPCYNSSKTIGGVVERLVKTVTSREGYDYEIILVNDCSPDNVMDVIKDICSLNGKVKGVSLAKNFGQHSALMAGFHYVTGDVAVCLDDDGQTAEEELFTLVDRLGDDCDLVYANYPSKKHSLFRNLGSKVNDAMAKSLLDKPKELSLMSYFACKRYLIDQIKRYTNPYPYVAGLLLKATNKIKNVDIPHRNRLEGKSNYTYRKLFSLWLNGFTAFSVKPLRAATLMGFFVAIAGFLYGLYVFVGRLMNIVQSGGYASMMVALLLVGGIIMMLLGMIGEYIGRIYISINTIPQFVVRETFNVDTGTAD
ncbi:MAG: glycosyltransferase [Oscillospiraceae bacterium]|jgi:undecaprenyl-phosphate 4-deoxy-4-formamido-L-arabinose transferase|nr:glycosyltransferase [Oscillospiraceae bacterium]